MPRSRLLYAVPAVLALAITAAVALPGTAAPPASDSPAVTPSPGQSYWPHQTDLSYAAMRVEDAARERWPHRYAGVVLDVPGNALFVHRLPGEPGFDQAVRALVPFTRVRVVDAVYTEAQLNHWTEVIHGDTDQWRQQGVEITLIGPHIGECVTVGVEADPDRARPLLAAHYPQVALCVQQEGRAVPLNAPKP